MAASPITDVRNMDEENSSEVKTEDSLAPENGDKRKEEETSGSSETVDPFKKPAMFAVPPNKRVASTAEPGCQQKSRVVDRPEETTSDAAGDSKILEKTQKLDESTVKERRQEFKPEVAPVKAGKFPPLPYTEPPWGGPPSDIPYSLEILKNGTIVDTVPLTHSSYFVVGRLPVCHVSLEHPSISRYHAVIQFRGQSGEEGCVGEERGFYIHDLGSTHGTVVNKNKVPPKTYVRLHVGHVLKFGGSTRLFVLQGPEFDEEEESELTVTELRERARKQRAELEKRMMGNLSDGEEEEEEEVREEGSTKAQSKKVDSGCTWGMDEEAAPEEDENEENPFSTEFLEDQEAAYLKDPKKALQGFYDREGEELEFEYEDKNHGTWLCRIKLPVDDAAGRQLVAEVTHTGKKKEAAVQCCLEACRMLEARGLLRQEAVSRKRRKKNWEDEDYYDSDDDTFLDRTGTVEKKRQERMKKAGKLEERPDTYESLVAKLSAVETELADTQRKLNTGRQDSSSSSTEDSLDAFMTAVRSEASMDAVERRKLHVHVADLRKEAQRLRKLVDLTRPAQMPSLLPGGSSEGEKPKKTLPLFGAMKGGSKFKLKTGTIGKLPPKRPSLPAELFNMKELPPGGEEEEEEEVLAAMERAHRQALDVLQKQHERQMRELEKEKDRLLQEEAQDTARVMDALKKKHKEELEREVERVTRLSGGRVDPQTLRTNQQAEAQALQRELASLSERYSHKCLDLNRAEQRNAEREREISQKERDVEQLRKENLGLKVRLTEEMTRVRSADQNSEDHKDKMSCELEVLLRVKENEIEYLHKEISCLRSELQFLNTEKQLACERYAEVHGELNGMKGRTEREIQSLKEHLRLAMAALQEGQKLGNSLDH
uniref:Solute carrier family 4 (Anion exchanger), member 1, adaptor protein n=1 Tax=Nothobranchius kuhntae TaxID=321403 RepID=A0A1A8IWV0_NOTKU